MSISAKDLTLDFVNADPFIALIHDLPAREDKRGVEHDVDEGVDHCDQDEPNADGNPALELHDAIVKKRWFYQAVCPDIC